jgi:Tfp pilus assembly protein PilO
MQLGWRTMLFVVLLLAMLVASYPILFLPLQKDRDAAKESIQKQQQKLNDLAAKMAENKSRPEDIKQLQKAIALLENKLPAATEMDKVLKDVWKAAEENKLTMKSVRNGKVIEGANYNQQPVKMVIEGPPSSPGFYKFLSQVEGMQRLTKINEMLITADATNPGIITVDMTLTIFYEASQKVAVVK